MRSGRVDEMKARWEAGVILDGGLATELERLGFDLDDPLWSARVLIDEPDAIQAVHLDYLMAGAECITTASYQASVQGLEEAGLSRRCVKEALRKSVQIAHEACDYWVEQRRGKGPLRFEPLVAASVGPYGAYLADGSEFRGDYDLSEADLYEFHAPRFEILAEANPDLFAMETIPLAREARALARLMKLSSFPAWVSFTFRDEMHTAGGDSLDEAVAAVNDVESIVAVGVNCVSPDLIEPLIEALRSRTDKPIVAYPNAGETWNACQRQWEGEPQPVSWPEKIRLWKEKGATALGGCCRTTPEDIKEIARVFRST